VGGGACNSAFSLSGAGVHRNRLQRDWRLIVARMCDQQSADADMDAETQELALQVTS
jgi:hypothetical protein